MEAGDRFAGEAREFARPPARPVNFRDRHGLGGAKLAGLLAGLILIAILAVYGRSEAGALYLMRLPSSPVQMK